MYAVVLAGGSGTRLWPRSRQRTPKQLLDLADGRTMLEDTVERVAPLVPAENVLIVTNAMCAEQIAAQPGALPAENVIVEPAGRNTAPAIGLGALHVRRRDPTGVMVVLSADHLVRKRDEFVAVMSKAATLAEDGYLVTIGIRPSRPETGYGYIELGEGLAAGAGDGAYRVARFTEKPDAATALQFVSGGRHLWNAGMFVWRVDSILAAIERHLPDLHKTLVEIDSVLGTEAEAEALPLLWRDVKGISVDFGIMERADNVAVVPADLGWSDIGTWASLAEVLPGDEEGNVVTGAHLGVGTRRSLIHSCGKRLIATIGLEDMIVVDTEDALLICPKDRAQDVKELVDRLKQGHRDDYL